MEPNEFVPNPLFNTHGQRPKPRRRGRRPSRPRKTNGLTQLPNQPKLARGPATPCRWRHLRRGVHVERRGGPATDRAPIGRALLSARAIGRAISGSDPRFVAPLVGAQTPPSPVLLLLLFLPPLSVSNYKLIISGLPGNIVVRRGPGIQVTFPPLGPTVFCRMEGARLREGVFETLRMTIFPESYRSFHATWVPLCGFHAAPAQRALPHHRHVLASGLSEYRELDWPPRHRRGPTVKEAPMLSVSYQSAFIAAAPVGNR